MSLLTATREPKYDWTPRLSPDGTFYCSPSCGGGHYCRKEWHDRAVRNAQTLALRLGDDWEGQVWENLGWHYKAVRGITTVREHEYGDGPTSYQANIEAPDNSHRGHLLKQFIGNSSKSPEEALAFAQQAARAYLDALSAALAGAV